MKENEGEEEEEKISAWRDFSQFLQENKELLSDLINKLTKHSIWTLYIKHFVVLSALAGSVFLCFYGKISGETLAGLVGVILGYTLGRRE